MEVVVKAKGADEVSIDELFSLQGNLKELTDENYAKLRDLILTKGFDSPIQVWVSPEGRKEILDGHQRLKTLLKLREEGYSIPNIPIDYVYAENKRDAKERLLTKVSQYGDVTENGFAEFINEEGAQIEESFSELLDIPGLVFEDAEPEQNGNNQNPEPKLIACPSCGHEFKP